MSKYKYVCKPDDKDDRDYLYESYVKEGTFKASVPRTSVDIRKEYSVPAILDQGNLGACVSNEVSNALRYCLLKYKNFDFQPSRLFIYYFARLLDGAPLTEDTGTSVRAGLKAVARYGAPSESWEPYVLTRFADQPSKMAMSAGRQHIKSFKYLKVSQNLDEIKRVIADGFPVICGVQVYSSFESDRAIKSGNIPMPDIETETLQGGHCVALYGYDDEKKIFIMMNSWGTQVGQQGWFTIP